MKHLIYLMTGLTLLTSSATPLHAHSDGAITIHEVEQDVAPKANLEVEKDPTGGFNVHVVTSNFVWRPEKASKEHVLGEGHAHVYLDGQKIMRIYNEWFHLNTYQFSSHSGEQILSVEFVGNDHAPYTTQGVPVGSERVISVLEDEIQPTSGKTSQKFSILVTTLIFGIAFTFIWRRRNQTK
jgi:hypothetical protein